MSVSLWRFLAFGLESAQILHSFSSLFATVFRTLTNCKEYDSVRTERSRIPRFSIPRRFIYLCLALSAFFFFTSLALSEAAVGSSLLPVLGGTAAAAGVTQAVSSLVQADEDEDVPLPVSP